MSSSRSSTASTSITTTRSYCSRSWQALGYPATTIIMPHSSSSSNNSAVNNNNNNSVDLELFPLHYDVLLAFVQSMLDIRDYCYHHYYRCQVVNNHHQLYYSYGTTTSSSNNNSTSNSNSNNDKDEDYIDECCMKEVMRNDNNNNVVQPEKHNNIIELTIAELSEQIVKSAKTQFLKQRNIETWNKSQLLLQNSLVVVARGEEEEEMMIEIGICAEEHFQSEAFRFCTILIQVLLSDAYRHRSSNNKYKKYNGNDMDMNMDIKMHLRAFLLAHKVPSRVLSTSASMTALQSCLSKLLFHASHAMFAWLDTHNTSPSNHYYRSTTSHTNENDDKHDNNIEGMVDANVFELLFGELNDDNKRRAMKRFGGFECYSLLPNALRIHKSSYTYYTSTRRTGQQHCTRHADRNQIIIPKRFIESASKSYSVCHMHHHTKHNDQQQKQQSRRKKQKRNADGAAHHDDSKQQQTQQTQSRPRSRSNSSLTSIDSTMTMSSSVSSSTSASASFMLLSSNNNNNIVHYHHVKFKIVKPGSTPSSSKSNSNGTSSSTSTSSSPSSWGIRLTKSDATGIAIVHKVKTSSSTSTSTTSNCCSNVNVLKEGDMIIGLRRIINRNDVDYDVDYDYNNGVVESVVLEFQECVRMFQTYNELNVTVLRERERAK